MEAEKLRQDLKELSQHKAYIADVEQVIKVVEKHTSYRSGPPTLDREKIGEWLYIEKWGHSWDAENELYKESWRREADRLINFVNA